MDEILYNGVRFTKFGKYYRSPRKFLHRAVWEDANGPIPEGFHVHHKDGNRENNALENLDMVEGSKHLSEHHKGHGRRPVAALAAVVIWRQTEEGKKHLSMMGLRNHHYMRVMRSFKCDCCGKDFIKQDTGINRFCSNNCKSKWRRDNRLDWIAAVCEFCGNNFETNKLRPAKCCSRSCGKKRWIATEEGRSHISRLAIAKRK